MKKLLSIILSVAIILSCVSMVSFSVNAASNTALIEVETINAKPGETAQVKVSLKENPGIWGMDLRVSYDKTQLTLTNVINGEIFADGEWTQGNLAGEKYVLSYAANGFEDIYTNGTIAILEFKVSEDATVDTFTAIMVSYNMGDIINVKYDDITAEIVNGGINITNVVYGDLNGDGLINKKDDLVMRMYLADLAVEIDLNAADLFYDGTVNKKDLLLLKQYLAGWTVEIGPKPNAHIHTLTAVEYKAPTCTEDGVNAHWYCAGCEKYYSDADAKVEIAVNDVVISAVGHNVVIDEAVAPTYTTSGLTEGSHCETCGVVIVEQEVIPPTVLKTYEIDYDMANGDPYLEKLLKSGKIINPNPNYYEESVGLTLLNPSVPGYRFLGWYDLAENGTLIKKIDATETGNYQLYAYWSKIEYTVQYKSSLFVERAQDKYTVDTGLVLPTPKLSNYTFTGWADEDGNLYTGTMIPAGTTENLVLEANWTSERNKTWTKTNLDAPIQYTEDNTLFFVYEIGEIQNVPLYTIKDFGYIAEGGVEKSEETKFSMVISEGTAQQIAESVEKATTSSSNWTLSNGWTDSTDISQEWLDEKGYDRDEVVGYATNEETNWNISTGTNGSTDTSTGTSNEKGWTNEAKITSSSSSTNSASINAGLESSISAEGFGVKAEISASLEAEESTSKTNSKGVETGGSKTGTNLKTTETTTSSGWSNSSSYGGSKSSSKTGSISTGISEVVTEKYGYGKNYTSEYTSGESQGLEFSNKGSEEWSSSVTYNIETAEEVTRSWTTEQTKAGYHRWVMAGIAHVFAVVAYDMETQSYYVYTYTVMDDKTYEYEDYSYTSATYNDHENGVISFEIPYEVAELVAEKTVYSKGLKVDQQTGIITGYDGTDNCVVIPEYMNVGNGEVVKIAGLAQGVFKNKTSISAVVLSDFITEIPKECFYGCTNLEGITGGSITKIYESAFAKTAIAECAVRSQVDYVEKNAFEGVGRVYFNCVNGIVLQAADDCGASEIYVDLAYLNDISKANDITLSIPNGTDYFEIKGNEKTVNNMIVLSDAKETVFTKINLSSDSYIPIRTSSEKVVFNQSSVCAKGIALVLSAEHTDLYLQSTINISSENKNAILGKSLTLLELNQNVDGRLSANSKVLYVGEIENSKLIINGSIEKIDSDMFNNLLNSYTLYFDAKGGSCDEISRNIPNSVKVGTLPVPAKTHYNFEGWFLADGTAVTADSVFSTGQDVYIYAKWTMVPYKVSWNTGTGYSITVKRTSSPNKGAATGNLSSNDSIYYGDVLAITYTASTGYNLSTSGKTSITVTSNVTASDIYASAVVKNYTVSWTNGTGYSITVKRTSSPLKGATTGTLSSGAAIYYGDVLSVTYTASTGYSISSKGSTSFTVTRNITKDDIYANVTLNSYTYKIVYESTNGTSLGSSTATYKYGTTNTITAPAKNGYITPASQTVKWDSVSSKTITFKYTPVTIGETIVTGSLNSAITYSTAMRYRNRTKTSVEVQITTTVTMEAGRNGYQYGVAFDANCGSASVGKVQVATLNTLSTGGSSRTASSGWITVPLNTTNATTLSFNANMYNTNWENNYVNHYEYSYESYTWKMNIPAY